MATVGNGQYTYEVVEDFIKLPQGWTFGTVAGVAVDSQGRVYICQQQEDPPILVFDQNGNYLNSWGTGTIVEPHSVYIDADNIIYLSDRGSHMVSKLTLDGSPLLELGNRGQPSDTGCTEDAGIVLRAAGPFNRPTQMFPAPSGDLYVSDGYRNSRVHRFSGDGGFISSWGAPGKTAPGEFHVPHSVWVDGEGRVYVCDRENNRIQIFSLTGEFITQWAELNLPGDIFMDANDTVYVYEGGAGETGGTRISILNKSGDVLARWDSPPGHQIWVDSRGDIYLTVPFRKKLTKYVKVSR